MNLKKKTLLSTHAKYARYAGYLHLPCITVLLCSVRHSVAVSMMHAVSKKGDTVLLSVTSLNIDRFPFNK